MEKKDLIKQWLKNHKYCVIATSRKNKPWAATVNYTVDDDLNIYIRTGMDTLKFRNLLANPTVCLVIDSQTREGTLQLQGVAEQTESKDGSEPNILIRPEFFVFKKKGKDGKPTELTLEIAVK